MTIEEDGVRNFLQELYQLTQGDLEQQVSMYDIGATLGLEKNEAGAVAEGLIFDGFAELVTLTGGISITTEGLKALDIQTSDAAGSDVHRLSSERMLSEADRSSLEELICLLKNSETGSHATFEQVEGITIDLKTLEVQMLSSKAKTAIVREILISMQDLLQSVGCTDIAVKIGLMLGR